MGRMGWRRKREKLTRGLCNRCNMILGMRSSRDNRQGSILEIERKTGSRMISNRLDGHFVQTDVSFSNRYC
jgi:hypothetical protein